MSLLAGVGLAQLQDSSDYDPVVITNRMALRRFGLTADMARLNHSQYFYSEANDAQREIRNFLVSNRVGNEGDSPAVEIGAVRIAGRASTNYGILVIAGAPLSAEPLQLFVDGTKFVLRTHPQILTSPAYKDRKIFETDLECLRALANAKNAKARLATPNGPLERQFNDDSIGRFQVFVQTFIDGRGMRQRSRTRGIETIGDLKSIR
jgi:hypothetical protein